GDQQSPDAGGGHHFRFAELRAGDAERAGGDLPPRDLRAAVGLRMRPEIFSGTPDVSRHAFEIALEPIEIDQQGRGRNVVAVHGVIPFNPFWRPWPSRRRITI